MDIQLLVQTLLQKIEELSSRVLVLEAENALLKNKKNSKNSHIPPTQDPFRPKKNQSLREPTDKKVGGQLGHEGTTLQCSTQVDEVIKHTPTNCKCCGCSLSNETEKLVSTRQVIDIPPIILTCTAHQLYKKQCSCGHVTTGNYPKHITSHVQYGSNIESIIAYLHTRHYMPYKRTQEFLNDVMGLPISVGGISHVLQRIAQKALPIYDAIKAKVEQATCLGVDETGVNINGKNNWAWTWQNHQLTYIVCAASRGFATIQQVFENGLPNAVLIHDRWPCHFQTKVKGNQICIAHLFRDLNYINQMYKDKCVWAKDFKKLLQKAIALKKEFTTADYYYTNNQRDEIGKELNKLLLSQIIDEYPLSKKLQKKLLAKQDCILNFLKQSNVMPDNNGSERAIRNFKVKQKISGQFKTLQHANVFAVLRSVIDTTIKNGQNIFNALRLIANFGTE